MTSKTCIDCKAACPSESIRGALHCVDNRASGETGRRFSYRCVSFSPSREACNGFVQRTEPIVFPTPPAAAPAPAPATDLFDQDEHFQGQAAEPAHHQAPEAQRPVSRAQLVEDDFFL